MRRSIRGQTVGQYAVKQSVDRSDSWSAQDIRCDVRSRRYRPTLGYVICVSEGCSVQMLWKGRTQ